MVDNWPVESTGERGAMTKAVSTPGQRSNGIRRIDLAYAQLASSELARDMNRDLILELIRTRQPIARADLSRLSGLQPSTVSLIAEQLLRENWIVEGAAARRPRGRRPTLLSLNGEMVILVADIRPDQAILAVVDLNGRFLSRETLALLSDPERGVSSLVDSMLSLQARYPGKSFEGIGISLPGRVDPESQRLIHAPNLKWSGYDIKGAIEKRTTLQVEMDNAANACLLSELWFGKMDGIRHAVLVTISEGIGAAILANGQLVIGRSGLAGEFGHVSIDPAGPLCHCGQHGCWEMYASSRAALRFYAERAPGSPCLTVRDLLNRAEDENVDAMEAFSRQARYLGQGLALITTSLSPDLILLTGDLPSWSRFGPIVEEELKRRMLAGTPPRLMVTSDGDLARLRGAAALVLQRHSGYPRLSHQATGSRSRKSRGKVKAASDG